MTISCDGYAVRVTVPRPVADWARANRREVLNSDWRANDSDYVISERWTEALRGLRVSLTTTIDRSRKDESFGFGSRQAQVVIHDPEPEAEAQ